MQQRYSRGQHGTLEPDNKYVKVEELQGNYLRDKENIALGISGQTGYACL